jgi:hypothetical protein
MKIFIICSKHFYDKVPAIKQSLEELGHDVTPPSHHDDPGTEARYRDQGTEIHSKWVAEMIRLSTRIIEKHDAVFVLNFEKHGIKNYIGGGTFLEMYDAFRLGKKIFLYNKIPDGMLRDEIVGLGPIVTNGDLGLIV